MFSETGARFAAGSVVKIHVIGQALCHWPRYRFFRTNKAHWSMIMCFSKSI